MNPNPLVSIVVITYNSSKYILDALESAKELTYGNIELIISDDCSTDDTLTICREWVKENSKYFVNTEIIPAEKNAGIPANCNKGCRAAHGEYVKILAGDDMLSPNGIEDFINCYGGSSMVVECGHKFFSVDKCGQKNVWDDKRDNQDFYRLSAEEQHERLLMSCCVSAPSVIIKAELFSKIGYFDESYKYIEDWPFWLKYTSGGGVIDYASVNLVCYRVNHESVSVTEVKYFNYLFYKDCQKFKKDYIYPRVPWYRIKYWWTESVLHCRFLVLYYVFGNKKNAISKMFSKLFVVVSCKYSLKDTWRKIGDLF